jgi:TATA-binding protein-associated factor Taf7
MGKEKNLPECDDPEAENGTATATDSDDDETCCEPVERSYLAQEISNLKSTVLKAASERERLPQPLFWSLFNSRLKEIRKAKQLERIVAETLES